MTRKDASGVQTPTEQYRKQIGKQEWKKSKKEVKAQKRAADQQSQVGITGALLVVVTLLLVMGGIYLSLYWYLGHPSQLTTSGEKPV